MSHSTTTARATHTLFALEALDVHFQPASRGGGVQALRDVTLNIASGEHVALVGANGCGKSTLLRVLHGLVPPTRGRLLTKPAVRQAMLFQRPHMLRTTAQNNVALGLWLQGQRWRDARQQALLALDRVGLTEHAQRHARRLSGGQ